MSLYHELSYESDICHVKGIQFSILSPEEILRRSVVHVMTTETYVANQPVPNGLFDAKMGVIDKNRECETCKQRYEFCPGHYGHIELARPMFYYQFFDVVKKLLKFVCHKCSRLLLNPDNLEVRAILEKIGQARQKRWDSLNKISSSTKLQKCECGAKQPDKIVRDVFYHIVMEWKNVEACEMGLGAGAGVVGVFGVQGVPVSGMRGQGSIQGIQGIGGIGGPGGPGGVGGVGGASDTGGPSGGPGNQRQEPHKRVLFAKDVLTILKRITDADAEILGFSPRYDRPEWMICTVLPIPPPHVRPSVKNDTGARCEDDLTHKLSDIIKANNSLKQKINRGTDFSQLNHYTVYLQYNLFTLIDNNIPHMPLQSLHRSGRQLKPLRERLCGKEGRIRGNLMGKRVDFSARSVISPDPNISIDELGVPYKIAMELTFPEIATPNNLAQLQQMVENGPDRHPGARLLTKTAQDNKPTWVKGIASPVVEVGDVVHRHLYNGDYVLFNRQPSLHKMSMMAHRIRVMPDNTFRLNATVTAPYNADFDGDEMNLHVPQSYVTRQELKDLCAVQLQILSPRDSQPIISIVQDVPLGLYRMTKPTVRVTAKQFGNLVAANPLFTGILPMPLGEGGTYTGLQLLSTILPHTLNVVHTYQDKNTGKDAKLIIEHGELIQGNVTKETYQTRTRGLVHTIFNDNGPEQTRLFLDNTQTLVCDFLQIKGFSVGVGDLVIGPGIDAQIESTVAQMHRDVEAMTREVHAGLMDNKTAKSDSEYFEEKVNNHLNGTRKTVGDLVTKNIHDRDNRLINMIYSGSKGSTVNVSQMMGCVGQQNIDGKRIPYGFDDRTLPHFCRYDDGPQSRGFVENSFIKGLTPQEFFFHAMGGREGIIDTAVKTSETGYIQRKLIKAMEDCKVVQGLSVRNASDVIVQFLYGEDGFNATSLESQALHYVEMGPLEMEREFHWQRDDSLIIVPATLQDFEEAEEALDDHFEKLKADREFIIVRVFKNHMEKNVLYPIAFGRILHNVRQTQRLPTSMARHQLTPSYVLQKIQDLIDKLRVTEDGNGMRMLHILLRMHLSPKVLILKWGLTRESFDSVVRKIVTSFYDAIAHPGEMVGVVAAQSIGEPATQLTLNSVHYDSEMLLRVDGRLVFAKMGEFCEAMIARAEAADSCKRCMGPILATPNVRPGVPEKEAKNAKERNAVMSLAKAEKGEPPEKKKRAANALRVPLPWSPKFEVNRLIKGKETYYPYQKTVESHPNDTTLAWLKGTEVKVLSCDKDGLTMWDDVEAVTRHPVVNVDGSDTLVKVTTQSGRSVVATKGKSFLKRVDNQFVGVNGDEIRVGDHLPVLTGLKMETRYAIQTWDVALYLRKQDWIFTRDVRKCYAFLDEGKKWIDSTEEDFTLPYKRNADPGKRDRRHESFKDSWPRDTVPLENLVCDLKSRSKSVHLPEHIPLTPDFGFFCGAYLAEGHVPESRHQVHVSNVDDAFNARLELFLAEHRLQFHYQETKDARGHSKTLWVHSTLLGNLFAEAFGRHSEAKHLPAEFLDAPEAFQKALIDGYFSGDGCIESTRVSASSVSRMLLDDIQLLLTRFGIMSKIALIQEAGAHPRYKNNQACYKLSLSRLECDKFATTFAITLEAKAEKLEQLQSRRHASSLEKSFHDVKLSNGIVDLSKADAEDRLKEKNCPDADKEILRHLLAEQVFEDEVVAVEDVDNGRPYVYDFTTRVTKNFAVMTGTVFRDTFHMAGVSSSSASQAVRGVPRMKELIHVSKTPKSPIMLVYLTEDRRKSRDRCDEVKSNIQITGFKHILKSMNIYFEPDDFNSTIPEDREFIKMYREFRALAGGSGSGGGGAAQVSPWLLRIELDRDRMLEHRLSMIEVNHSIKDYLGEDCVSTVFSDDNAQQMVLRIKLPMREDKDIFADIKAVQHNIMENIIIRGIPRVKRAVLEKPESLMYNAQTSTFEKMDEYVIVTEGANFKSVLAQPGVDTVRTSCNDVHEVYNTLGIEAARNVLFNEITEVMMDVRVNYRHLSMLIDTITNRGILMPIGRHGINRCDTGPLAKSSFEETSDMLIKAGIFAELDRINGVSANMMLGQIPNYGTGDCGILIDSEMLQMHTMRSKDVDGDVNGDAHLHKLDIDFQLPQGPIKNAAKRLEDF
jgi:DNA-directed RNA polymerase beta' subunit